MADPQRQRGQCQTICVELSELDFQTLQETEGRSTVIRFRVPDQSVGCGDVLVVLDGSEISFHGMISNMEDGWAVASDVRGSSIPISESTRF